MMANIIRGSDAARGAAISRKLGRFSAIYAGFLLGGVLLAAPMGDASIIRAAVNHAPANHPQANHAGANHPPTNHPQANHPQANHAGANHPPTNHPPTNHARANLLPIGFVPADEPRITLSDSLSLILPMPRPDPALALPEAPAGMILPEPRPDRTSLYPATAITLGRGYFDFTAIEPQTTEATLTLKSGEGLAQLLGRGGINPASTERAIRKIGRHISLRRLPIGFEVTILPAGTGHEAALRISIEDDLDLTLIETPTGWDERLSIRPIKSYLTFVSGVIDTSLYEAAIDAGMRDSVFNTFVQVLSFSVDFQREIRTGDRFEALIETRKDLITGKPRGAAELHFVSLTLSGDRVEFFRHHHLNGTIGWYDEAGNSASRTLMRTPINGARLSSGYGQRKHPVLGYSKMHQGVDFAAPTGTPIMAAGSGVVEFAGRNGSYGNYIRIRHNSTYKTAYAHLSRIGRGISPGVRVAQGEVIGFVGNTGRSTGPHLHYEILVNNRKVNPLKVRLPAGKAIPEEERAFFADSMAAITSELHARGILRFAQDSSQ